MEKVGQPLFGLKALLITWTLLRSKSNPPISLPLGSASRFITKFSACSYYIRINLLFLLHELWLKKYVPKREREFLTKSFEIDRIICIYITSLIYIHVT